MFLTNDQRIIHKWTHYFPVYESHFERFRNKSIVFLEIGCGKGGSLQMWKRYFGPFAQIVGVDVRAECKRFEEDQIAVRIGSQGDPDFLAGLAAELGQFAVVLDDGSHKMQHLRVSFQCLYPHVETNAVYMVEDMHICYWQRFGGGYKAEASFMEKCKDLLDELNADQPGAT